MSTGYGWDSSKGLATQSIKMSLDFHLLDSSLKVDKDEKTSLSMVKVILTMVRNAAESGGIGRQQNGSELNGEGRSWMVWPAWPNSN
jgi:hypothetical protein